MPGLITHYLCAEAALKSLPPEARAAIGRNRGLYNVGAQGPDIFFYDIPGLLRRARRGLGTQMHTGGAGRFVAALAGRLSGLTEVDRAALLAYVSGYLTHYCLDATAHPYVYYKTGFPSLGGRAIKYSARHRAFETALDVLMLAGQGEKPGDRQIWRMAHVGRKEADGVPPALAGAILEAYGVGLSARAVFRSMAYTKLFTRAAQSKRGRRKRLAAAVERVALGGTLCSDLIHPQAVTDGRDYMNLSKAVWRLPYDEGAERTDSFPEMFEAARNKAAGMIAALFEYAGGRRTMAGLMDAVGDYSLKTGAGGGAQVEFRVWDARFWN